MELMTGRTENIAVVSEQKKHSVKEFHDILRGGGGGGGGLAIVRVYLWTWHDYWPRRVLFEATL